jgi:hypothetical protein
MASAGLLRLLGEDGLQQEEYQLLRRQAGHAYVKNGELTSHFCRTTVAPLDKK